MCVDWKSCVLSFQRQLTHQRYSRHSIYSYSSSARQFLKWLSSTKKQLSQLTVQQLNDYIANFRTPRSSRRITSKEKRNLKARLSTFLRLTLSVWPPEVVPSGKANRNDAARLALYMEDMKSKRGLAPDTVRNRFNEACYFLGYFRKARRGASLTRINTTDLDSYLEFRASKNTRSSMVAVSARFRLFIRYLFDTGVLKFNLSVNIEGPRRYENANIPDAPSAIEISKILRAASRESTQLGRRDYAILLLLSAQGMRSNEVRNLRLDDIDWDKGEILVRASKSRKEFQLPLLQKPADAIIEYLRVRPHSDARNIFLVSHAPYNPLGWRTDFGPIVARAAAKAQIKLEGRRGGHILRHAFARRLLNAGVSLKLIGDVLGHSSGRSTMAYLKVPQKHLCDVALDPPKVAR